MKDGEALLSGCFLSLSDRRAWLSILAYELSDRPAAGLVSTASTLFVLVR